MTGLRTFRAKFTAAGLAAAAVSIGASLFLAETAERAALGELLSTNVHLTEQTARTMAPLLAFDSRTDLLDTLKGLRGNRDVVAARVMDNQGQPVAAIGTFTQAGQCQQRESAVTRVTVDAIRINAPVSSNGNHWGCMEVEVSKYRFLANARRMWQTAIWAAILTLALCLAMGAYLSKTVARPLEGLASAARKLGAGALQTGLAGLGRDTAGTEETRAVAEAFELMVVELRRTMISKSHVDGIIDSLGESLIVCGADGTIRSVNRATLEMLGYEEAELIGRPLSCVLAGEGQLTGPGHAARFEDEYVNSTGGRIPVSTTLSRMDSGPEPLFIHVARDVSEKKKTMADLIDAKQKAEQASLAKSQFLANITHELRTPLNSVISFAGLIEEELEDRSLNELVPDVRKINSAAKHLLGIVCDILDLSKIEAGRMSVSSDAFSLARVVREVAETAEPLAAKNRNQIVMAAAAGADIIVYSDEQKFRQSLMNLVGNACKFTRDGEVRLAWQESGEGRERGVEISVQDTGIGMSSESLGHLFEAFSQVDSSAGRRFGGTGLGLAISRHYCRLMGGDLVVESESGVGSKFTIQLPLKLASPEESQEL
jgi:PAS domain S-box-containing protein